MWPRLPWATNFIIFNRDYIAFTVKLRVIVGATPYSVLPAQSTLLNVRVTLPR